MGQEAEQENWWVKEVRPYLKEHWRPTCRKRSQCQSCTSMMMCSSYEALVSEKVNENVSQWPAKQEFATPKKKRQTDADAITPLRNSYSQSNFYSSPGDRSLSPAPSTNTSMLTTPIRRWERCSSQTNIQRTPDDWDDMSERSLRNSTTSRY